MSFERQRSGLRSLFDEIEELVSSGVDLVGRQVGRTFPTIDIVEEENAYRLLADVPGMSREDIAVKAELGKLVISGEKKRPIEPKRDRYGHFERSYGSFSREFKLPDDIDLSKVEAKYSNGVLELILHKQESGKSKPVDIKID